MTRRLINLLALLSLLLCAAVAALWVRSYRGGDHASWGAGGERRTFRSEGGVLALFRAPRRVDSPVARRAQEVAARLTNDDIQWYSVPKNLAGRELSFVSPMPTGVAASLYGEQVDTFSGPRPPGVEAVPPLLAALDDPQKFLAAHALLADILPTEWDWTSNPDESVTIVSEGMRIHLRPVGPYRPANKGDGRYCTAAVDPADFPAVREKWRRQLDVPVVFIEHGWLVAAGLVLPVAILCTAVRRAWVARALRRRGLCPACGYDLRATPGRCPECGAATPAASLDN